MDLPEFKFRYDNAIRSLTNDFATAYSVTQGGEPAIPKTTKAEEFLESEMKPAGQAGCNDIVKVEQNLQGPHAIVFSRFLHELLKKCGTISDAERSTVPNHDGIGSKENARRISFLIHPQNFDGFITGLEADARYFAEPEQRALAQQIVEAADTASHRICLGQRNAQGQPALCKTTFVLTRARPEDPLKFKLFMQTNYAPIIAACMRLSNVASKDCAEIEDHDKKIKVNGGFSFSSTNEDGVREMIAAVNALHQQQAQERDEAANRSTRR